MCGKRWTHSLRFSLEPGKDWGLTWARVMYSFRSRFPTRTRILDSTRPILRRHIRLCSHVRSLLQHLIHTCTFTVWLKICSCRQARSIVPLALTILDGFLLLMHWQSERCNAYEKRHNISKDIEQSIPRLWDWPLIVKVRLVCNTFTFVS